MRDGDERQARRQNRNHDRLWDFTHLAHNPGRLRTRIYVPENLAPDAPLVVVLHGSLQSAAEYDDGSGWSKLADLHGFALLFPQQRRLNNPVRAFNWFAHGDSRRNAGEPLSIVAMVSEVADQYRTDPKRVFVTGLSSGGAMTSVLLATYPEVFAGGAIIAGLPYAAPATALGARERMRGVDSLPSPKTLAADVRGASDRVGSWPIVSVWHGGMDETVDPSNTGQIVAQWCELHGLDPNAFATQHRDGHTRKTWRNRTGREVVEEYVVSDMGHGAPILESDGTREHSPAYMLTGNVSSTQRIASFWGITPPVGSGPDHRAPAELAIA